MNRIRLAIATAIVATCTLSTGSVQAHPGHGLEEGGVTHMLTSPYHLSVLLLTGLSLLVTARFVQEKLPRRTLQVCGTLALLVAGVLWGTGA